jgi:hypothetical protein
MKKALLFLLLGTITLVSCNKEEIKTETSLKPALIKVDAIHNDGSIVTSNVILVR